MRILCRLAGEWRRLTRVGRVPAGPELWCRPATLIALRDRNHAGRCLAGWR